MPEPAPKTEFATKQDLLELELRLTKHIEDVRAELLKEFGNFKMEFGNFKTTLVMWNVGLIVALFAALKFIP